MKKIIKISDGDNIEEQLIEKVRKFINESKYQDEKYAKGNFYIIIEIV